MSSAEKIIFCNAGLHNVYSKVARYVIHSQIQDQKFDPRILIPKTEILRHGAHAVLKNGPVLLRHPFAQALAVRP